MGMGLRCAEELVEGLELGTLLGRGGFGSVFRGTWFGTPVRKCLPDTVVL
jgi:hypothetical protein